MVVDTQLCSPATRGWCLFEWGKTVTHHGLDALYLVGMTLEDRGAIVREINVAKAECFDPKDREMILADIEKSHGSVDAFNYRLKLALLLTPVPCRHDLALLWSRSMGTLWNLETLAAWLADGVLGHRVVCVMGGAGEGKSSASAAMLREVLGRRADDGRWTGPVTAFHFTRHDDKRRTDPVAVLKSLVFQVAERVPALGEGLFRLDPLKVSGARDLNSACALFLPLLAKACAAEEQVVVLLDALDEGDPPEQQRADFDRARGHATPVGNQIFHLLVGYLAPMLPGNFRFFLTTRPDAVVGTVRDTLDRTFAAGGRGGEGGGGQGPGAGGGVLTAIGAPSPFGAPAAGAAASPFGAPAAPVAPATGCKPPALSFIYHQQFGLEYILFR